MSFPQIRMLRYRQSPQLRQFLSESTLRKEDLIAPLFVNESLKEKKLMKSFPNVYQHSIESMLAEIEVLQKEGILACILFGIPAKKSEWAEESFNEKGIVQEAIRKIKSRFPQFIVLADCCLCEYTNHGGCGIIEKGKLSNDKTLQVLQKIAVSYAAAGADIIAPSGMMDGMVRAIRKALDDHDFEMTAIMSYASKFASEFYGPFREAAGSGDVFVGDRKHHQLAFTQVSEAIREALIDVEEGADYLMVKPSIAYLDIIKILSEQTFLPLAAYHTSGEYAMLKLAAKEGIFKEENAFFEVYTAIKRAGAKHIITYYAKEMARFLGKQ